MEHAKKKQESTLIIGLGKATHHMLADKKENEPHIISSRGEEVLKNVVRGYGEHREQGKEVHVIFVGNVPNYNTPQKFIPLLRKHAPTLPQAEMFKDAAVRQGILEQHITTIPKGTDLMQNLMAVKKHLQELDIHPKIEIHVDGYQTKRTEMVAKHVLKGYELEVKPVYVQRNFGMKLFTCGLVSIFIIV
jgi:hypothetical protein